MNLYSSRSHSIFRMVSSVVLSEMYGYVHYLEIGSTLQYPSLALASTCCGYPDQDSATEDYDATC